MPRFLPNACEITFHPGSTLMSPLISIENLSIQFGDPKTNAPAVDDLTLRIGTGEFLALVGESGSGKSVTALSLLQLLPKTSNLYPNGKIQYYPNQEQPIDLIRLTPAEWSSIRGSKISMIFQEPMTALNPLVRCGEQIAEVMRRHKKMDAHMARSEAIKWIERVQIPNPQLMYDRFPHQLSGGQKQRILIAAALCCGPDLLICDEPTTALDVTVQKEILELIRNEQQKMGMAVLFISHDLALVSQYANRVAVMYQGKLVEEGASPHIFQQPNHPYTRALLACRPAAHRKGDRLPMVRDFLESFDKPPATIAHQSASKAPQPTLFRAERLSIRYPGPKNWLGRSRPSPMVVQEASFEIKQGEVLGLVGESGSGKSTLGRAVLGMIKPCSGSMWHQDQDLLKLNPAQWPLRRKQLQLIFQDPYSSLNPRMPIGEAIGEALRVHRLVDTRLKEKEKVMEWLQRVQLKAEHYNRYPHEFSGGQRQRIVIARALALEPEFVVCDESVSALDVSVQAQVLNLLNDLRKELNFTTLFISHDLGVVRYLCDRLLVLKNGQIVESGEAEQVCSRPEHPYTQNLLQAIPQLKSVP